MIPRYLVNFNSKRIKRNISDILVIGSGIAGLTVALDSSKDFDVSLITKGKLRETSTWYAQGGVATAISDEDSPELHLKDTLRAGAGLCNKKAVKTLVSEASDAIDWLVRLGAEFDLHGSGAQLAREGGHTLPRILKAKDSTGQEVEQTLVRAAEKWQSVRICERTFSVDLLIHKGRCIGALVFDLKRKRLQLELAAIVILATGGCGQLFRVTTNPSVSTGDGIAMAYRAGAKVTDMEFVQFHPTALDENRIPRFLISEALRGEGAYLKDGQGKRFMEGVHPLSELAPRDVVVREMVKVLAQTKADHVFLDARHIGKDKLTKEFPTILKRCKENGYDLTKNLVPVAPAAHYMIGGVKTDTFGRTNIEGLYACGEAAATGVHGANRLASNSLLEGLVFSHRICKDIRQKEKAILRRKRYIIDAGLSYKTPRINKRILTRKERAHLQGLMSKDAGPSRSEEQLKSLQAELDEKKVFFQRAFSNPKELELNNMVLVAGLITKTTLRRKESRGVHFRADFPKKDNKRWKRHIVLEPGKDEIN